MRSRSPALLVDGLAPRRAADFDPHNRERLFSLLVEGALPPELADALLAEPGADELVQRAEDRARALERGLLEQLVGEPTKGLVGVLETPIVPSSGVIAPGMLAPPSPEPNASVEEEVEFATEGDFGSVRVIRRCLHDVRIADVSYEIRMLGDGRRVGGGQAGTSGCVVRSARIVLWEGGTDLRQRPHSLVFDGLPPLNGNVRFLSLKPLARIRIDVRVR